MTVNEDTGGLSFLVGNQWKRLSSNAGIARKICVAAALLLSAGAANAKILYVNKAFPVGGNGSSWGQPFKHLQNALDAAAPGDLVYLAKGTYFPDEGGAGRVVGDREISFILDRVKLYGGFAGNETSISQRNPAANPTILSGEIWKVTPTTLGYERYWSLHVVELEGGSSTIDSITVENGRANGEEAPFNQGGGCYVPSGFTLTLNRCTFRGNNAASAGGAVFGKVVATSCTFSDNFINNQHLFSTTAVRPRNWLFSPNCSGGAIAGDVTASFCTFLRNSITARSLDLGITTSAVGGAIAGTNVRLNGCNFFENTAVSLSLPGTGPNSDALSRGGAIDGAINAINCTFVGNSTSASSYAASSPDPTKAAGYTAQPIALGGAISGKITAANCTFDNNSTSSVAESGDNAIADSHGGAIYSQDESSIVNCILFENETQRENFTGPSNVGPSRGSGSRGGGLNVAGGRTILSNSTFLDNSAVAGGLPSAGAALASSSSVIILSNIFWDTVGKPFMIGLGGRSRISNRLYPTPSTETINILKGGIATVTTGPGANVDFGEPPERTLPDVDPLFVNIANPKGADNAWRTGDDGLRLLAGSPAIGKANLEFLPADTQDLDNDGLLTEKVPVDAGNFLRVQGGSLDLGAFEFGNLTNFPDISIEEPINTALVDGASTVDFGTVRNVAKTFTIRNTGTGDLSRLAVQIVGANPTEFKFSQPLTASIRGGSATTFTVTFSPQLPGPRTAVLQVTSNDVNESPFDIVIKGNVLLPDIAVQQPVSKNLVDGQETIGYGTISATASKKRFFTVLNTGKADLTISGINVSGPNAKNFKVSGLGSSVLAPNASTTFLVTFRPLGQGGRKATVTIVSNDPDAESQFSVNLTGRGRPAPEIAVKQPFGKGFKDGGTVGYGDVKVGQFLSKEFIIRNTGTAVLKNIKVGMTGPAVYALKQPKVKSLKPGNQTTFTVTFKPTSAGAKSAKLRIASNDADENPFNLTLNGKGIFAKGKKKSSLFASSVGPLKSSSSMATGDQLVTTHSVTRDETGAKYLVLTVEKDSVNSVTPNEIEVSSDLMDWYSGTRHTTVVTDNASILQVRDNTPTAPDAKRFIRIK